MPDYIPDFDYGGEIAEKESNFKLWNTTGQMTALIDADLLPYRVGFILDELKYLEAINLVNEGHFKELRDTPQFEDAFDTLCAMLNRWVVACKCDSAILYSTKSDSNFRLDIAYTSPYKGQRVAPKPPFFQELKDEMESRLGCILCDGHEADDALSIEAWRRFYEDLEPQGVVAGSPQHKELCDVVICSSDKDSTITPVYNYNPDTRELQWVTKLGYLSVRYKKGTIKKYEQQGTGIFWKRGANAGKEKTKRVCVGEAPSTAIDKLSGAGLKFFYSQIITGDAADNYIGLKGKGKSYAYELLDNVKTEANLYLKCLNRYKEVYGEGTHWCPHFKGTKDYYDKHIEHKGCPPEDWEFWKGKGAFLTALDRMLEQGRLAWMQTYPNDMWLDNYPVIDANDKGGFWHDFNESD